MVGETAFRGCLSEAKCERGELCQIDWCVLRDFRKPSPYVLHVSSSVGIKDSNEFQPEDFWREKEEIVSSLEEAIELIREIYMKHSKAPSKEGATESFAWRGQLDSRWGLTSSLYRRVSWREGRAPTEDELQQHEAKILLDAKRWGLHVSHHSRLSLLQQLALMQHYRAPTRLIDVSFSPLVALWFASEGGGAANTSDGRLFAFATNSFGLNENEALRGLEDEKERAWDPSSSIFSEYEELLNWNTQSWLWKPTSLDRRIAAQNGAFILGGTPVSGTTSSPNQWPKLKSGGYWSIDEVRQATSVSVKPNSLSSKGARSSQAVYTIRLKAECKALVRRKLEYMYGLNEASLFPDVSGFADQCKSILDLPNKLEER